jgi:hypothetical protein
MTLDSRPPFLDTPEQYRELFDSVDTFLLDCDGVIYHGPVVVEGVKVVLQMMRDAGEYLYWCFGCGVRSELLCVLRRRREET